MTPQIVVIAHDIRSSHNIGSLLRTCEGLGVERLYFTGYTPYPAGAPNDERLPHIAAKLNGQIAKTALGAETMVAWSHHDNAADVVERLRSDGFRIAGLEQAPGSIALPQYAAPPKLALVLGREVEGIDRAILALCDDTIEIPMYGRKESFNVVQAAAMALYHLRTCRP